MPVLNWVGKEAVVNHDKDVQYKLLKKTASVGKSENLIIEGDNLEALKALLPFYEGKIKCIYIDPPYNTGNENWVYNDNVNSPKIKKWLGKVVGSESEDLTHHDKWLCMMYPRLKLLEQLLHKDGFIFVSIDENEIYNLRQIMNDVFGPSNFRNSLAVRRYDKNINLQFAKNGLTSYNVGFEYVVIYSKNPKSKLKPLYREASEERSSVGYWKGFWNDADRKTMRYDLLGITPENGQWKWKKEVAFEAVKNYKEYLKKYSKSKTLEEYWIETGKSKKFIRRRSSGKGVNKGVEHWISPSDGILRNTLWQDMFASKPIKDLHVDFNNPKNPDMIKELIKSVTDDDEIILDSFAGSGTTGHAVLEINHEESSNRKFVLVELESKICKNITSKRIKNLIKKNNWSKIPGFGFDYHVIDKPLFENEYALNTDCSFEDLASHVFYNETKTPLDIKPINNSYIGEHHGIEYYLFFNPKSKNSLTLKILETLPKNSKKVIYAGKCTVEEDVLDEFNAVFRQIPYDIRRF